MALPQQSYGVGVVYANFKSGGVSLFTRKSVAAPMRPACVRGGGEQRWDSVGNFRVSGHQAAQNDSGSTQLGVGVRIEIMPLVQISFALPIRPRLE